MLFKKIKIGTPSFASRRNLKARFLKINLFVLTYLLLFISIVSLYVLTLSKTEAVKQTLGESTTSSGPNMVYLQISPTIIPELTRTPTETPTPAPILAQNISKEDTTKTIQNVENSNAMATASDIFNALNSYRNENGISSLSWDDTLATFAQGRVNTFESNNSMDDHAGFSNFMNNNGFEVSGFNGLGENSAQLSGPMDGNKIIREVYASSSSHNASQLDPAWTHAGVAINGIFVNINFGRK